MTSKKSESAPHESREKVKKFNFEELDFSPEEIRVVNKEVEVKFRRNAGSDFFRIRPAVEVDLEGREHKWRANIRLLNISGFGKKFDGTYVISPELQNSLGARKELTPSTIYCGIAYTTGSLFIADIPLEKEGQSYSEFHSSRARIYEEAETKWVRYSTGDSMYLKEEPTDTLPEPDYPETPANIFQSMEIAFRDRVIDDYSHPVLKRLRGEL